MSLAKGGLRLMGFRKSAKNRNHNICDEELKGVWALLTCFRQRDSARIGGETLGNICLR